MYTIKYFMWEYQHHFQVSTRIKAEGLFSILDKSLVSNVFLIGVLVEDREDRHPICLEPENCGFQVNQFDEVEEQALHLEATDELRNSFHSNPTLQERHLKSIEIAALQTAVLNVLRRHERYQGVVSRCSWPILVDGYRVMVVLQFNRDAFNSHYSLLKDTTDRGNARLFTSLLDATTDEFFSSCQEALWKGEHINVVDRDYNEIFRTAGKKLMYAPAYAGVEFGEGIQGLFEACNAISSLRYEGEEGIGNMLIARKGHPNVEVTLSLERPVRMKYPRAVRKLLEISLGELNLLSDSGSVYGFGRTSGPYDQRAEDLFLIRFVRHNAWELSHDGHEMMQVVDGQPHLPKEKIDRRKFDRNVERIFSEVDSREIGRLWDLVLEATKQRHGSLVVISSGAGEEALRLESQATVIEPIQLTSNLMKRITAIDGAVLVDPSSTCHAIGVILDGPATEKGDPSRGARYNSAVRYVESQKEDHAYSCLAIVVSEDGTVDLLPDLMPQISRSVILEKIEELAELKEEENLDRQSFFRILDFLNSVKFYLSQEMCDKINQLRHEIEPRARHDSDIWMGFNDFTPHEDMNETYFLDETEQSQEQPH